jgi:hypothetical protein
MIPSKHNQAKYLAVKNDLMHSKKTKLIFLVLYNFYFSKVNSYDLLRKAKETCFLNGGAEITKFCRQ